MPFYYDFSKDHDNAYLRAVRKIYQPLGFYKGYNFPLWVIFGGAMFGFGCARLMYFDIDGSFRRAHIVISDWEYWRADHYRVGIILHLVGVLPICLLLPWQFLPIIRHAAMIVHRLNGYLCILLLLIANAGASMILRHSFGGSMLSQSVIGVIGILTIVGIFMAYNNVKRLQIDQHRAWMLRTWFIAGAVISQRIIQLVMLSVVRHYYHGTYYGSLPCHAINYILLNTIGKPNLAESLYPACAAGGPDSWAAVEVNPAGSPEQIGAFSIESFGVSGFIALLLHILGCEMYLHLTSAERDRLKQVSYERQLARGMKRPGDAGLTSEMWGDSRPWMPTTRNDTQEVEREGSRSSGNTDSAKPEVEEV